MTTPVTQLDFDALKAELIAHIKTNPTFTDYNFEGSALNGIMDILAYNAHNTAYYANMLHNESFLDTAQKRASVVSRAKELGYVPHSMVGSTAYINLTVSGLTAGTILQMSRGTEFTSSNDSGAHNFVLVAETLSVPSGTQTTFSSMKIVAGKMASNTYTVNSTLNPSGILKIPNKNIDITTLEVTVRESGSSLNKRTFIRGFNSYDYKYDSAVFYLEESYDGYYQIVFGDNLIGLEPSDGNVVEISYVVVADDPTIANECRLFSYNGSFGAGTTFGITTTQVSFGGEDRESLDSIRANAKLSNTSKRRAVSDSDYEYLLKEGFPFIKSVAVWGGEDNDPPQYGKVFISPQPVSGLTVSDTVKTDVLLPYIRSMNMMTIKPEFVDPEYVNVEYRTQIKFKQSLTNTSASTVVGMIRTAIVNYTESISEFNEQYVESDLIRLIADLDPGITSVYITKNVGIDLTPLVGVDTNYIRTLSNGIVKGSISSTKFAILDGSTERIVQIKEIPSTNELGIYDVQTSTLVQSIGTVEYSTGKINVNLNVSRYLSTNRFVAIRCYLQNPDIEMSRNQIIRLSDVGSDSVIALSDSNEVTLELV